MDIHVASGCNKVHRHHHGSWWPQDINTASGINTWQHRSRRPARPLPVAQITDTSMASREPWRSFKESQSENEPFSILNILLLLRAKVAKVIVWLDSVFGGRAPGGCTSPCRPYSVATYSPIHDSFRPLLSLSRLQVHSSPPPPHTRHSILPSFPPLHCIVVS